MKGHVLIVNNAARRIADSRGMCAVFEEYHNKPQWRKTRADILADLTCLRPGDRMFFYNTDNTAFWGIYEVTSRLFYDESDLGLERPAPYRFGVRPFLPLTKSVCKIA